ncbi:hypothetical protein RhiirC2_789535 [Rhizophagus irregularis]|uniref:Uncharacterized protein n=1 Tax=Rhizophagus irregularis TaxID=588596 RepID=A0A2N1MMY4_9GLOM|nr:hypothetical protein RhiirC2_789535 [Rhizophagus irregularis]
MISDIDHSEVFGFTLSFANCGIISLSDLATVRFKLPFMIIALSLSKGADLMRSQSSKVIKTT